MTTRAEISEKLWQVAEQHIVAEWICCEPLDPKHELCAMGYAALDMVKTLLVDSDPEKAWNPAAPWLDVLMSMLPPPVSQADFPSEAVRKTLRRWAYAAGHIESELDDAVNRMYVLVAQDALRGMADEAQQQQPDTETRDIPAVTEAEAERLATLTDCPNSRHGGLHCDHYQQGDGPCCNCQRPNWCPEGGVA